MQSKSWKYILRKGNYVRTIVQYHWNKLAYNLQDVQMCTYG